VKAATVLLVAALASISIADGLEVSAGPLITSLSPTDDAFGDRFLTPGYSVGVAVDLDAPGPILFQLGFEDFRKRASAGWDGRLDAILVYAFPCFRQQVYGGFSVHAGPGAVFADGSYSGTDDFGSFVEAEGTSVGFGFTAGADLQVWGPLTTRLEYRRVYMDMKTDRAIIDGSESFVYPAAETDLGYSQFSFLLFASLFGGKESIF
jgi:opacity protein-like surface antigen